MTNRTAQTATSKRYEVVDVRTGDRFGNHTHAEAVSRAAAMRRNWGYKKVFKIEERKP